MELGLFQLENLFQLPNRFLFLDLRSERLPVEPALESLLKNATPVAAGGVLSKLESDRVPKDFPIVLMCDDGRASARVARELEGAGYQQIYLVAGGLAGLRSEVLDSLQ